MCKLHRAFALLVVALCVSAQEDSIGFQITIENLSGGSELPSPFSPVAWAVHSGVSPLFNPGQTASLGLQRLAEDGDAEALVEEVRNSNSPGGVQSVGAAYGTPETGAGIAPGTLMSFGIIGKRGDRVSFAQMLVETNDRFYGTSHDGFFLFDEQGNARSGMVEIILYDAGTEVNERPGYGVNQPARQTRTNVGQNENGVVKFASSDDDTFDYPPSKIIIRVTITAALTFRVKVDNLSGGTTVPTALGPILWAVHTHPEPFFTAGGNASAGLELLAEDGNPSLLSLELNAKTGILFQGQTGPVPIESSMEFTVTVPFGSYLSFATMFVQSNDRFLAPFPRGIPLFNSGGAASGDITSWIELWDAGTEVNQLPGSGTNQPPRSGVNVGPPEDGTVKHALGNPDGFNYPEVSSILAVSAAPLTGAGFTSKTLDQRLNVNFVFSNMFKN